MVGEVERAVNHTEGGKPIRLLSLNFVTRFTSMWFSQRVEDQMESVTSET